MSRLVLGLNTDHADTAAALVGESGIIAALAEERISRNKHTAAFPRQAIQEVLKIAGADLKDLTDIAVARDPRANLGQKAAFLARHPGSALRTGLHRLAIHRKVLSGCDRIAAELGVERSRIQARFHRVEHHLAHVSSALYWSPFDTCCAFSIDGVGDFATAMWAQCSGHQIRVLKRFHWPHSLGVFYTALCQFIGFDRYGEEYKVMGLAAYGRNRYQDFMRRLAAFDSKRGLRLDLRYFRHHRKPESFKILPGGEVKLPRLWGSRMANELGPARERGQELTERDKDLAASMQKHYEKVFLKMVAALVDGTQQRKISLAGGCALNSVANGRMIAEGLVDAAYFQPAASDDGTSLGAALYALHSTNGVPRSGPVRSAFWGSQWSEDEIRADLEKNGRAFRKMDRLDLLQTAAGALREGKVVGWFQGREEWGPRALGNRSILCNPALPGMKATLNNRIKNREPFRPFAPVIREENLARCFEGTHPVPFMIVVYKMRPQWREKLPAVTHEDNTGRVQTVRPDENQLLYDLLGRFEELTGVPALLNTSFNENEPIVHTPSQAIECFERTKMDCLGIGPFWLDK